MEQSQIRFLFSLISTESTLLSPQSTRGPTWISSICLFSFIFSETKTATWPVSTIYIWLQNCFISILTLQQTLISTLGKKVLKKDEFLWKFLKLGLSSCNVECNVGFYTIYNFYKNFIFKISSLKNTLQTQIWYSQ